MKEKAKFGLLTTSAMRLVLFTILILLSGCTKFGKNVYVDGRVYNPITGEGIPNIPIRLYRNTIDSKDPLGVGSKTLETTTTDANGYYKVEHLSTPFNKVWIRLNSLDYYPIGWVDFGNQGEAGIKKGKKNHLDYQMVPYGAIIIYIKNTSCFDLNDNIKLYFDGGVYDSNVFHKGLIINLNGCVDSPDPPIKISSGYKYFHWESTKNGIMTTYYDTIFVGENQTTTLNVFY